MSRALSRPIFWPLVLVAIGVLWLLGNFNVISSSNLGILLQFWPVLLIGLGLDLIVRPRWPMVGNLIAVLIVTGAVLAVVFAPRLGYVSAGSNWWTSVPWMWGGKPGSGQVITEARPVRDFTAVSFDSQGELTIQQGEIESLKIEAETNVLPEILAEVRNGTLHIGYTDPNGWWNVRPTRPIRFTLTVKDLDDLTLAGAGSVVVKELRTDQLQTVLSGAGSLSLEDLEAQDVRVRLSGAGSVEASGTATQVDARVTGLGSYKGGDLQTESADVTLSGTGSAVVWATKFLNAHISGLGSVQYYGDPKVTQTVSGLGSVQRLGSK
jgi:hypothetical protein